MGYCSKLFGRCLFGVRWPFGSDPSDCIVQEKGVTIVAQLEVAAHSIDHSGFVYHYYGGIGTGSNSVP